jgi:hypothetical protein
MRTFTAQHDSCVIAIRPASRAKPIPDFTGPRRNTALEELAAVAVGAAVFG